MRSDWLLKLGMVCDIHLLIFFLKISHANLLSFLRKKGRMLCWIFTSFVYYTGFFLLFFILGIDDAITVKSHALYFSDSFVYTVMLSLSASVVTSI